MFGTVAEALSCLQAEVPSCTRQPAKMSGLLQDPAKVSPGVRTRACDRPGYFQNTILVPGIIGMLGTVCPARRPSD